MGKGKITIFSVLLFLIVVIVGLGIYAATTYNRAVQTSNQIPTDLAAIGIAVENRYDKMSIMMDALTQYDATVTAYITAITDARAAFADALDNSDVADMVTAETSLDNAFNVLAVFLEDNPAYLGTTLYQQYMSEVAASSNAVAQAKEDYNASVQAFNTLVQSFPANLFIGQLGFESGSFPLY